MTLRGDFRSRQRGRLLKSPRRRCGWLLGFVADEGVAIAIPKLRDFARPECVVRHVQLDRRKAVQFTQLGRIAFPSQIASPKSKALQRTKFA